MDTFQFTVINVEQTQIDAKVKLPRVNSPHDTVLETTSLMFSVESMNH